MEEYVKEDDWVFTVKRDDPRGRGSPVAMRIVEELQRRERELMIENQRLKIEVRYLKQALRESHLERQGWVRIKSRPVNIDERDHYGQEEAGN